MSSLTVQCDPHVPHLGKSSISVSSALQSPLRIRMASHSGAFCHNMSENIYIFQEESNATRKRALQGLNSFKQKRAPKQPRKSDTQARAVRICYWQDSCNRTECHFVHLPARFLAGKKKPYKLCYDFPKAQCEREHCQYVHWAEGMEILPGQADQADNGTENGTIPSLNFKSRGIGQIFTRDSDTLARTADATIHTEWLCPCW